MKKKIILVIATVLLLTVAVGTTVAYIVTSTNPIVNTFNPSHVTTAVVETGSTDEDGSKTIKDVDVKSNVQIKNTGDTEAWIRAAVVVTWKAENGNVYGRAPVADTDYTIDWAFDDTENTTAWVKGSDGYYYYARPVLPGNSTGALIKTCDFIETSPNVPDGYSLSVEIIASGIQSTPNNTVIEVWGAAKGGAVTGVSDSGSTRTLIVQQQGG